MAEILQFRTVWALTLITAVLILLCTSLAGCTAEGPAETATTPAIPLADQEVLLQTSEGDITLLLYGDMPITTGNFISLAEQGYYDNLTFHRVINGFMIQGGCPKGDGTGGPGYTIEDEFVPGHSNTRGTVAMANSGPNSGGSQFFINLNDNSYLDRDKEPLQYAHPVFGEVIEGMDVVDAIAEMPTDSRDMPLTPVIIQKAVVIT